MGMSNYIPSSALTKAGVCTSSTRPASPYVGQAIYETDTLRFRFWDGSTWSPIVDAPTGTVNSFAGATAPTGWLLCAGQAVSRATYADLFAVISTTYGIGDGSTTFNIPDLRGRTIAGVDNMGGSTASRITSGGSGITGTTLGAAGGTETHTLTTAQMPSHTHIQDAHNHVLQRTTDGVFTSSSGSGVQFRSVNYTSDTVGNTTATNQNTGGSAAHNNMQPTLLLNYIIRI